MAEGYKTEAYGKYVHVSGKYNIPDLIVYGYKNYLTYNEGDYCIYPDPESVDPSHSTKSLYKCIRDITEPKDFDADDWRPVFNNVPETPYVEIIGNGTESVRSNARTLDWSGNEWLAGNLTLGNSTTGGGNIILHYKDNNNTVQYIDVAQRVIPEPPTANGTYTLQCTVNNGVVNYQWV